MNRGRASRFALWNGASRLFNFIDADADPTNPAGPVWSASGRARSHWGLREWLGDRVAAVIIRYVTSTVKLTPAEVSAQASLKKAGVSNARWASTIMLALR